MQRYGSSSSSSSSDSGDAGGAVAAVAGSSSSAGAVGGGGGEEALLAPLQSLSLKEQGGRGLKQRRRKLHLKLVPSVLEPSPVAEEDGFLGAAIAGLGGSTEVSLADIDEVGMLGEGAQGCVVKGVHRETGVPVAVKRLRLDMTAQDETAARKRRDLFTEVKTYAQSTCPYVVRSYGATKEEDMISVVLEFMDCGSLRSLIERGALPLPCVAEVAFQVLSGLQYLHEERHLVHRDIKPENILLNSDGQVKISDFGVSKEVESTLANCDTFVGTIHYMAPERIDTLRATKGYGFASDIWALGLVLVECATGAYPYPSASADQLLDHMHLVCEQDPPIDEWLPAGAFPDDLRDLVAVCMQRKEVDRTSARRLLLHPFVQSHAEAFDFADWLRDSVLDWGGEQTSS